MASRRAAVRAGIAVSIVGALISFGLAIAPAGAAATAATVVTALGDGQSATVQSGQKVAYELRYTCASGSSCGTLTITDQLDPRLTYLAASAPGLGGADISYNADTSILTVTGSPFDAGASGVIFLSAQVKPGIAAGTIPNAAAIAEPDGTTASSAPAEITVTAGAPSWRLTQDLIYPTPTDAVPDAAPAPGQPTAYRLDLYGDFVGNVSLADATLIARYFLGHNVTLGGD
jgi:fimbrial isopeptide formation D2 family protein